MFSMLFRVVKASYRYTTYSTQKMHGEFIQSSTPIFSRCRPQKTILRAKLGRIRSRPLYFHQHCIDIDESPYPCDLIWHGCAPNKNLVPHRAVPVLPDFGGTHGLYTGAGAKKLGAYDRNYYYGVGDEKSLDVRTSSHSSGMRVSQ
mgnify:CR=1 FL=1